MPEDFPAAKSTEESFGNKLNQRSVALRTKHGSWQSSTDCKSFPGSYPPSTISCNCSSTCSDDPSFGYSAGRCCSDARAVALPTAMLQSFNRKAKKEATLILNFKRTFIKFFMGYIEVSSKDLDLDESTRVPFPNPCTWQCLHQRAAVALSVSSEKFRRRNCNCDRRTPVMEFTTGTACKVHQQNEPSTLQH